MTLMRTALKLMFVAELALAADHPIAGTWQPIRTETWKLHADTPNAVKSETLKLSEKINFG